jgi:putative copper resistance protein D
MLLFGGSCMRGILRRDRYGWNAPLDARLFRLLSSAALIALLTAVGWLLLEAASMGDTWGDAIQPGTLRAVLTDTVFGQLWLARLPLALLVCLVAWFWQRSSFALVLLSAALLASLALTGHAVMDLGWLSVVHPLNQALHLLAAGFWLGSLVPLGLFLKWHLRNRNHVQPTRLVMAGLDPAILDRGIHESAGSSPAMTARNASGLRDTAPATAPSRADQFVTARALRCFSDLATIAVLLVLGSGVFNAWMLVGSLSALISTGYGNALLVKLVLVAAMVALALFNRLFLLPALAMRGDAALPRLERNVVIEIVLGAVVLVVASVLGNLPPVTM